MARAVAAVIAAYLMVAYLLLPTIWKHYEYQSGFAGQSMVTHTAQGIPGDAINVGLVGTREDVTRAMHEAGWYPADPITLKSSIEIIGSVLLKRPYRDAPVSPLYYDGRREDLAFEKPVGESADRRQHVRFWQVLTTGEEGRPVWLGSATFDRDVGISHYTGAVTHHIAPDIDATRDALIGDLVAAHMVTAIYQVGGVGPTLYARNGEGDPYYTDGEVKVARLVVDGEKNMAAPQMLPPPSLVGIKDAMWRTGQSALR